MKTPAFLAAMSGASPRQRPAWKACQLPDRQASAPRAGLRGSPRRRAFAGTDEIAIEKSPAPQGARLVDQQLARFQAAVAAGDAPDIAAKKAGVFMAHRVRELTLKAKATRPRARASTAPLLAGEWLSPSM